MLGKKGLKISNFIDLVNKFEVTANSEKGSENIVVNSSVPLTEHPRSLVKANNQTVESSTEFSTIVV
ncbi:hypothetical protein TNCV_3849651 [Trichonephila clavipes]|nr:hypothetical protein TNCV_3849651 [Trichonephila clavipes]